MNIDQKRAEMKRAVRYRSGPGGINTVYLGGMATCSLYRDLGKSHWYGSLGGGTLQDAIDQATPEQLERAWNNDGFQWILKHYRAAGSKLYDYKIVAVEVD